MLQNDNNYYDIACNDIKYLEAIGDVGYYNQPSALCQQISEKLLKSLVENLYTGDDIVDILRSHSLKTLARAIKSDIESFKVDIKDLSFLTNYYFDTRYPGPDYHIVSKEDFLECIRILYDIKKEVDRIRKLMEDIKL